MKKVVLAISATCLISLLVAVSSGGWWLSEKRNAQLVASLDASQEIYYTSTQAAFVTGCVLGMQYTGNVLPSEAEALCMSGGRLFIEELRSNDFWMQKMLETVPEYSDILKPLRSGPTNESQSSAARTE